MLEELVGNVVGAGCLVVFLGFGDRTWAGVKEIGESDDLES